MELGQYYKQKQFRNVCTIWIISFAQWTIILESSSIQLQYKPDIFDTQTMSADNKIYSGRVGMSYKSYFKTWKKNSQDKANNYDKWLHIRRPPY